MTDYSVVEGNLWAFEHGWRSRVGRRAGEVPLPFADDYHLVQSWFEGYRRAGMFLSLRPIGRALP